MMEQILVKLGCMFVAICVISTFYALFGLGGVGFIAGFSLTSILISIAERTGLL